MGNGFELYLQDKAGGNMEIMPNSTITTEITPENTGRSIKNRRFISFRF
jgi:hypothetical protein